MNVVPSACTFLNQLFFRMCDKTAFISVLAWSVPGCVGATSDNPPPYTSCWRWTWSLFLPAATPSDDWRGRISWKIAKLVVRYRQNRVQITISRTGVKAFSWWYSEFSSLSTHSMRGPKAMIHWVLFFSAKHLYC